MAEVKGPVVVVRGIKTGEKIKVDDDDLPAFTRYKLDLEEGEVVEMVFRPLDHAASSRAIKLFHAIRDRYAAALGLEYEYAKNELMCRFGVSLPIDRATEAEWDGRLVEIWGKRIFRKSIMAYKKSELHNLIRGVEMACFENQISIADLREEYNI